MEARIFPRHCVLYREIPVNNGKIDVYESGVCSQLKSFVGKDGARVNAFDVYS